MTNEDETHRKTVVASASNPRKYLCLLKDGFCVNIISFDDVEAVVDFDRRLLVPCGFSAISRLSVVTMCK